MTFEIRIPSEGSTSLVYTTQRSPEGASCLAEVFNNCSQQKCVPEISPLQGLIPGQLSSVLQALDPIYPHILKNSKTTNKQNNFNMEIFFNIFMQL